MSIQDRLTSMQRYREELNRLPQTAANEMRKAVADLAILIDECSIRKQAAIRALGLLRAYEDYGSFEAVLDDGTRVRGAPHVTGNPVREYWVRCGFVLTGWLSGAWREREACAALCEHLSLDGLDGHEYAEAIRKRGA